MISPLSRRHVLSTLAGGSAALLSGCYMGGGRQLSARGIQPPVERDGQILIELRVLVTAAGLENSQARFTNVTLVGYTGDRRVVGQEFIGTIELREELPVTLSCSEMPEYITFTLEEESCDVDTTISVFRVNPPNMDVTYTSLDKKRCGDPDLPTPD